MRTPGRAANASIARRGYQPTGKPSNPGTCARMRLVARAQVALEAGPLARTSASAASAVSGLTATVCSTVRKVSRVW